MLELEPELDPEAVRVLKRDAEAEPEVALADGATNSVGVLDTPVAELWDRIRVVDPTDTAIEDPPPPLSRTSVVVESPEVVGMRSTKNEYGAVEHPKFQAV